MGWRDLISFEPKNFVPGHGQIDDLLDQFIVALNRDDNCMFILVINGGLGLSIQGNKISLFTFLWQLLVHVLCIVCGCT